MNISALGHYHKPWHVGIANKQIGCQLWVLRIKEKMGNSDELHPFLLNNMIMYTWMPCADTPHVVGIRPRTYLHALFYVIILYSAQQALNTPPYVWVCRVYQLLGKMLFFSYSTLIALTYLPLFIRPVVFEVGAGNPAGAREGAGGGAGWGTSGWQKKYRTTKWII